MFLATEKTLIAPDEIALLKQYNVGEINDEVQIIATSTKSSGARKEVGEKVIAANAATTGLFYLIYDPLLIIFHPILTFCSSSSTTK